MTAEKVIEILSTVITVYFVGIFVFSWLLWSLVDGLLWPIILLAAMVKRIRELDWG